MTIARLTRFYFVAALLFLVGCGGGGSSSGGMATESFNGVYHGVWTAQASAMTADSSSGGARSVGIIFSDTGSSSKVFDLQITVDNSQVSIEFAGNDSIFVANGEISSNGIFTASTSDSIGIFTQTVGVLNSDGAISDGVGAVGQYTFSGSIQNDEASGESSARFRSSVINDLDTGIIDVVVFIDVNGGFSASRGAGSAPTPAPFEIFIQL